MSVLSGAPLYKDLRDTRCWCRHMVPGCICSHWPTYRRLKTGMSKITYTETTFNQALTLYWNPC